MSVVLGATVYSQIPTDVPAYRSENYEIIEPVTKKTCLIHNKEFLIKLHVTGSEAVQLRLFHQERRVVSELWSPRNK